MVISNVGTIVLGLPESREEGSKTISTPGGAAQVRLLSLSNTCARLLVGPLSDYFAPTRLAHPTGEMYFPRKRFVSRLFFLCTACFIMSVAYLWMAAGVVSQRDVYIVSICTGVSYGGVFTVLYVFNASL